jgi:hypothetical protein
MCAAMALILLCHFNHLNRRSHESEMWQGNYFKLKLQQRKHGQSDSSSTRLKLIEFLYNYYTYDLLEGEIIISIIYTYFIF